MPVARDGLLDVSECISALPVKVHLGSIDEETCKADGTACKIMAEKPGLASSAMLSSAPESGPEGTVSLKWYKSGTVACPLRTSCRC